MALEQEVREYSDHMKAETEIGAVRQKSRRRPKPARSHRIQKKSREDFLQEPAQKVWLPGP